MKNAIFHFILVFAVSHLNAQSNCDFQKLLNDGKAAAKKENYELALNKFNSARRCDPDKGEEIDKEVEKLFVAINQKKKEADIERRRAEEQTKIAQAARDSIATLLKKFEAASAEIVDALAREANNLIYHLDYNAAAAKLRIAPISISPLSPSKKPWQRWHFSGMKPDRLPELLNY